MRIIGIDPGTDRAGFGIVDYAKNAFSYVESGILRVTSGEGRADRLFTIETALREIVARHHPERAGVETLFFSKNRTTALSVAEARGVILKVFAENSIPVIEISPMEVKLLLTGHGRAAKNDVARMAGRFSGADLSGKVDDETDAVAIAIAAGFKKD
jgi:crossover junction endodeoxyribonuclease RuvC